MMSTHDILIMMGLVISVAVGTLLLAERLKIPAIVPLLVIGVLLGPEVLGWVEPAALGDGLRVIISLIVAIIVFEGGLVLDLTYLRQVSQVVRNLITVGALVTTALAALAAVLLNGFSWPLALLFGALVCVTGPTVINPLLRRATVTQRLKTILIAEGVLIDAVGAVLAVVILDAILAFQNPLTGAADWAISLTAGALIGIAGGWLLAQSLNRVGREFNAELTRLTALGGALAIYTLAEAIATESGIAAAAAAGIVLGNLRIPHEHEVRDFKGDLTQLGIGLIFILLAAGISFSDLAALGWAGLATVAVLMLVVRPATVFMSTVGLRMKWRERLFIAAVGPRGIVAASFATFASLRLAEAGYAGSESLAALVFLVIIGTVVTQSFTTPFIARFLGVQPMLTVIVGAESLGRDLARHLQNQNEEVVLIDRDTENVAVAREEGLSVVEGDATRDDVLRKAGIERANGLVTTTFSDKANLLICQMVRSRFHVTNLVARVNDEGNLRMFTELGIRAMSPNAAAVMVLDNLLRRPNTLNLLANLASGTEVQEVELRNGRMVGRPLKHMQLDGDVLVTMIRRADKLFIPHGDTVLALHDQLTLIGSTDHVGDAVAMLSEEVVIGQLPVKKAASELEAK